MKTPRIKKEYMYLIIVLLLGLILSSFVKPFMEGFREGADESQPPASSQSPTCATGFTYLPDDNLCSMNGSCSSGYRLEGGSCKKTSRSQIGGGTIRPPICTSVPGKDVRFAQDHNKCVYTP